MDVSLIVTSVNYADYLLATLQYNHKIFSKIYVVTSTTDFDTQEVCKKYSNAICLPTNIFYENNAPLNKGSGINYCLNFATKESEWIVVGDADCIFPKVILEDIKKINIEYLYSYPRIMCKNKQELDTLLNNQQSQPSNIILDPEFGFVADRVIGGTKNTIIGYCQMFNIKSKVFSKDPTYPTQHKDAAWSDIAFNNRWTKNFRKILVSGNVIHLGERARSTDCRVAPKWT
jgi:hypothetical protein